MIELHGEAAIASLKEADSAFVSNIAQSLGQATELAKQVAKATDRFKNRTGRLRASIARGKKSALVQFVQAGNSSAFYAGFVEFGTVRMAARRFMQNARDVAEPALLRFVENGANHAFG